MGSLSRAIVEVVAALGILANLFQADHQADDPDDKEPPELADKGAQAHHDPGGQRQGDAQADKQVGENRDHPLQQRAHDQERQADHRHRVDQS